MAESCPDVHHVDLQPGRGKFLVQAVHLRLERAEALQLVADRGVVGQPVEAGLETVDLVGQALRTDRGNVALQGPLRPVRERQVTDCAGARHLPAQHRDVVRRAGLGQEHGVVARASKDLVQDLRQALTGGQTVLAREREARLRVLAVDEPSSAA